ncbi:low temperature requirement protein A [Actinomadura sp. NBRC 104412]|uniref:low temperature requirement protein A n=1 Tax=Actinomadura sp. NBRC 104412 TaxID=3032203 RepID=UPI0024A07AE3|nr:low temperature requirement protein A [Actinomadura sp. NBRC 104412]GLZ05068.1 low temperature requirement protein A [Actinomadura sp. NBRC 104412]
MARDNAHPRMVATDDDHRVTPAELFFDLVFVYALIQITALLAEDPTPLRLLGGAVVIGLLWWCWCCFAWLGNVIRADTGALLGVLLVVMSAVLIVSMTVSEVYADAEGGVDAPLVFVLCYGLLRTLHLIAYWIAHPNDPQLRAVLRRTALTSVAPPFALLLIGSAFSGATQILIWLGALVLDYVAIYLVGGSGWRVTSPGHFAERHGLILIIALGESITAIGVGVRGFPITLEVLAGAVAALLIAAGLWRLYFKRLSADAEERLTALDGDERTLLASNVYTFLHLPLVAGVVLTALGVETALHQVADTEHYDLSEPLHGVEGWSLAGGVGLFLLAAAAIRVRIGGRPPIVLIVSGVLALFAGLVVVLIPALLALVLLAAATAGVTALHGRSTRSSEPKPQESAQ